MCTVGTTAYAKFVTEIYPSVIFPSFGSVLESDETRPGAETTIVLRSDDGAMTVTTRDWFEGPPSSALDQLSGKLAQLSSDNSEWMFARADELAGTCVERIDIVIASREEAAGNRFDRHCG